MLSTQNYSRLIDSISSFYWALQLFQFPVSIPFLSPLPLLLDEGIGRGPPIRLDRDRSQLRHLPRPQTASLITRREFDRFGALA